MNISVKALEENQLAGHQTLITLEDSTANPAPLGLRGFDMTKVLLNIHNAGLFDLDFMILAMGILYGGCTKIIGEVELAQIY